MKYLLLHTAFFACISFLHVSGQTYTFSGSNGSTLLNLSSGATVNINVSGVPAGSVLRQVNLKFGDGTSQYSASIYQANVTLKNPANITKNLITTTSLGGATDAALKWFNIHLRDHSAYLTPGVQKGGGTVATGYPFNYGYYAPAESWSAFNSSTINGTWTLTVNSIGSTTFQRKFNSIELIFGPALPAVTDVRGTPSNPKPNETCATKQCIQTGGIYLAKNTSYASQNIPAQTIDGCFWNADDNNKSWFYFVASSTTAEISISAFTSQQQSVVVKPISNSCSNFNLVSGGGCMGTMFTGTASDIKYYNASYNTGNGSRWNHGYSLTGLVVGNWYVVVVEGSSNANSEFIIEIPSGATGGCSALPIELLDFKVKAFEDGVNIAWETATERDNDYFTVSRSGDMINWEVIGTVAGSGNTTSRMSYEFTDADPLLGVSYYQLQQTDYNGMNEAFDPVSVNFDGKRKGNFISIYPNPANDDFEIRIRAQGCEDAAVQLFNLSGKLVRDKQVKLMPGQDKVKMEKEGLQKGIYFVNVVFPDGEQCSAKLVVE